MSMRLIAVLTLAAAACASTSAAAPSRKTVEDDELARIPDMPPAEVAERIIQVQGPEGVTGSFMIVELNLRSADQARVRWALAVLEALAASIDRKYRQLPAEEDGTDVHGELVDHVREILDQRLRTAPCALVFAVEHAAGEFDHLPVYVPPMASHSPLRKHHLSDQAIDCGMQSIKEKVRACDVKHDVQSDAMVRFVVSNQGTVTSAATLGRLSNTPTGDCVAAAVKTVTFPPADEVITLTYPYD